MEEAQITYIGKTDYRNKLTKFGIKAKDRTKHMYVIGKTGTGKSTFLENMLIQDIQNGNGLAFMDPHGESARRLLDYIPEWRANDVIYFNPADTDFPVAFNPLEDIGPDKRHLVADGLMSVFEKIWPEAFSGRATYILNNTMLALLESPDSSMMSINRMLTDKDYRKRIVANVTDPVVKNVWETDLMKWDEKRWSEAVGTLINKVGQFTSNPVIRNIIGQSKSTFDFRKAMDERKIIIMNLSKGMIGEQNAPLIGALLITKIYLAAMSRSELPQQVLDRAAPFYFYVDEFQNFANDSFASILSEARKYKLCLTVANQYIAQMEETIRDAVFGNMGTTVAFRVGPLDAEFVEKVFAPVFTQEDLQNVMFGQYYISLQIDGMGSKPFSAQGLGPIPPIATSVRDQVIELSRKQFARPKIEVDAAVREWFGPAEKRVIRPDIGNKVEGDGKSRSDQKFDPKVFDEKPAAKPLPPVSGFVKKEPVVVKQNPVSKSVPVAPKKDSMDLASLLNQLDTAVVVEKKEEVKPYVPYVVPDDKPKSAAAPISVSKPAAPIIQQQAPIKSQNPASVKTEIAKEPIRSTVSEIVPKASPLMQQKPLAREATPEKKNALAEVLARAMGEKSEVKKVEEAPSRSAATPILEVKEEQAPVPESIPLKSQTQVEPKPEPEEKNTPKWATPPTRYTGGNVVREVPEDILRQVLE